MKWFDVLSFLFRKHLRSPLLLATVEMGKRFSPRRLRRSVTVLGCIGCYWAGSRHLSWAEGSGGCGNDPCGVTASGASAARAKETPLTFVF